MTYGTECDIWSLGVIFHEMLFKEVPWKGRDERDLLNNILKSPFNFRKTINISKFSEEILNKTLIVEEKERISWVCKIFNIIRFSC